MACVDNKHENYRKPVKLHFPSISVQTHRICALWRNIVKIIRVLGEMEVFTIIHMNPVNNFQWKTCFSSMRDCFYRQLIESFVTWCSSNPQRSTNELVLVYCCICEYVNYWQSQIPCMCSCVWLIKHQILKCASFKHKVDPAAQTARKVFLQMKLTCDLLHIKCYNFTLLNIGAMFTVLWILLVIVPCTLAYVKYWILLNKSYHKSYMYIYMRIYFSSLYQLSGLIF